MIRAVLCVVGEPARVVEIDPSYEVLRAIVGGTVETAFVEPGVEIVVNEENRINGMKLNRVVPAKAPPLPEWLSDFEVIPLGGDLVPPGSDEVGMHVVCGTFLVCGDGWTSLDESTAELYRRVLDLSLILVGLLRLT